MHSDGIIRREKESHLVPKDVQNQDSLLNHLYTLQVIIIPTATWFNKNAKASLLWPTLTDPEGKRIGECGNKDDKTCEMVCIKVTIRVLIYSE